MSDDEVWDDEARADLRDSITTRVLGELRLSRYSNEQILGLYQDGAMQEECPEEECNSFLEFAAREIERLSAQVESEKADWPSETDCDRLDQVELALRDRGIVLWQASPCCDNCSISELGDRIDVINECSPGFSERIRGYVFFIDQQLPDALSEGTQLTVYLGYGWVSTREVEVPPDMYERHALAIADEVYAALTKEGFTPIWNRQMTDKIALGLNWQRRTMLQ